MIDRPMTEEERALAYSDALIKQTVSVNRINLTTSERHLLVLAAAVRGMREALDDMKYALEKMNGAVDAMWNDPAGRTVSARHQADITHAQQVAKKTLDDHAPVLSGIETEQKQARSPSDSGGGAK